MQTFSFLILFSGFIFQTAIAVELPPRCFSESAQSLELPVDDNYPEQTFTYRYGLSTREDADAPLMIFIPGGPGQTSMDMGLSYPIEFAVVRTDPRGVGCNLTDKLQPNNLSSEAIARDIVSMIKSLNPKRYFIHAISHGTLVATIAASIIAKENMPQPEGIILEGTIGKAFGPDEYAHDVLLQWKRVKEKLPGRVIKELNRPSVPFGLEEKKFAAWINAILIYGMLPDGSDYALEELKLLDPKGDADLREGLQMRIKRMTQPPSIEKTILYKEISCREFVPDVRDVKYDYEWKKGELILRKEKLCTGINFDRPYDSKNYPIKAAVYYFSGGMDPVTPQSQAIYHSQHQKNEQYFINVLQGGHTSLSTNLSDCSNDLWQAILAKDHQLLKNQLKKCGQKSVVNF